MAGALSWYEVRPWVHARPSQTLSVMLRTGFSVCAALGPFSAGAAAPSSASVKYLCTFFFFCDWRCGLFRGLVWSFCPA